MNSTTKQLVKIGDVVTRTMPWSEACMQLRVQGQVRSILVTRAGAQILNHDGSKYSFEVGLGEAGIHTDECGRHYVPSHEVVAYKARPKTTVVLFIRRKVGDRLVECSNDSAITACLDRYVGDYDCSFEEDALGRRCRVTLPVDTDTHISPPPADRLRRIALSVGVPAAIED